MLDFLFGIHNHQPVGNFEHVFEQSYQKCYFPLLSTISDYPHIKVNLHHSGPLLEWLLLNHPQYLEMVKSLVEKGQVEIIGGAFYEPILPVIPTHDIMGQLELMQSFLEEHIGVRARGIWLPERVWEQSLVVPLARAKIDYTILDDTHFYYTGLKPDQMYGYYTTEDSGSILSVFPIHKSLRYLIPFRSADECLGWFLETQKQHQNTSVTMGDDGEKFGVWPETYEWVYEKGYLKRLFELLGEHQDQIRLNHFSVFLDNNPPSGHVYLPNSSYEEMGEWSLPTDSQKEYTQLRHELESNSNFEQIKPFIKGGVWRNFFTKYSESNHMHKKMLFVSRLVNDIPAKNKIKSLSQKYLWQGQCNCPFWHGLFGGLYLNYLRHAIFSSLIKAENIARSTLKANPNILEIDYDQDRHNEFILQNNYLQIIVKPNYGSSLIEIDYLPKDFNITNVLTRRPETYHEKIAHSTNSQQNQSDNPTSIHDIQRVKEEGLENKLFYDWHQKLTFLDHFISTTTTLDDLYKARYQDLGDFTTATYQVVSFENTKHKVSLKTTRNGLLTIENKQHALTITKTHRLEKEKTHALYIDYDFHYQNQDEITVIFSPEINLSLLAGDAEDRYININNKKLNMNSFLDIPIIKYFQCFDEWSRMNIYIESESEFGLWGFPIETISQSESGMERVYQGTTFMPHWELNFTSNSHLKKTIKLTINEI